MVVQYRVIGLIPMAVGLSQSLAQRSGTVSQISSGTRQSALTLSDVYWRRICLHDTSACSALEVDNFMRYILIYLLTYLWQVGRVEAVSRAARWRPSRRRRSTWVETRTRRTRTTTTRHHRLTARCLWVVPRLLTNFDISRVLSTAHQNSPTPSRLTCIGGF